MWRARRGLDGLTLAVGLLALAVHAYVLTGRGFDLYLMRGLGPRSIAIVAASELAFLGAVWSAMRLARASRGRATLAAACAVMSIAAIGVMLRHPLTGAFEFRHHDRELQVTQAGLVGTAALLVLLWRWNRIVDAVAHCRANGETGWRLALTLGRLAASRARGPAANLALSAATILITLIFLEGAARLLQGVPLLSSANFLSPSAGPFALGVNRYDPVLGWVHAANQTLGTPAAFSTGEQGVRMNGPTIVPVARHAILAVGDSFTAGSAVDNAHTWPAQLEAALNAPVVNAAAGGWGSDQIVLRAESLIPIFEPREIIVSFLASDIVRAAYATFGGGAKPYFTVEAGGLVPHNIPVPHRLETEGGRRWRHLLGYSRLARYVIQATGGYESWAADAILVSTDFPEVSCLLLERLKAKVDLARIPLTFILQYDGNSVVDLKAEPADVIKVVTCAQQAGFTVVDTWQTLRAIYGRDPAELARLYDMTERPGQFGHMSAAGNALIAGLLADALKHARERR
jgi:hypothetical protein